MRQLVIIGRDGVLVDHDTAGDTMLTPEQLRMIPGSLEAIARLNHAGIRVALTVIQPDTGEDPPTIESLNAIHARMQHLLARRGGHFDALFVTSCKGSDDTGAQSALDQLEEVSKRFSVPLEQTTVVDKDPVIIEAALTAGATAVLVPSHPETMSALQDNSKVLVSDTLADVVAYLLQS